MADSASTIVIELMSSTNDDTEVNGMSYRSCGLGPVNAVFLYSM